MARSNAHVDITRTIGQLAGLPMLQAPTPVQARRPPAYSSGHAIQSAPLPNPTGLPHNAPAHQLVAMGRRS